MKHDVCVWCGNENDDDKKKETTLASVVSIYWLNFAELEMEWSRLAIKQKCSLDFGSGGKVFMGINRAINKQKA